MRSTPACSGLAIALTLALSVGARAQVVEDGSDAAIGKPAAARVLDLIGQRFKPLDPKVTALRKAEGTWICGAVNVKNRDGLYIGERGFVVDLATDFLGRVPEGPELLNPRAPGFQELEHIRQLYFTMCLD
ncbi:hypothetical protein [Methylobacterium sp. J-068]|uniref:hypothetical protein n=1 Tax=Methylobacterium sp. J-068 TaxID=2836649 RepID=UPI001FB9509C|nr:hypothetical protein [Methylobacterium sp. J-068]MCJ2035649.1 hypothetical protein [Methylobacterium sp. J-068]